jgi:hypothetical protein
MDEIEIGISNLIELLKEGHVEIEGFTLRLNGDTGCDPDALDNLSDAALALADKARGGDE